MENSSEDTNTNHFISSTLSAPRVIFFCYPAFLKVEKMEMKFLFYLGWKVTTHFVRIKKIILTGKSRIKEAFLFCFPRESDASNTRWGWEMEEPQGENGVKASPDKILDVLRKTCSSLKTEHGHQ